MKHLSFSHLLTIGCKLFIATLLLCRVELATAETHTLVITTANFNGISYVANNNDKTTTVDGIDYTWCSNQVMLQSSTMQWQKNAGYIYNKTALGVRILSIQITSSKNNLTVLGGTSQNPTSGTVMSGTSGLYTFTNDNPYFLIKTGALSNTTRIEITFETISCTTPIITKNNGTYTVGGTILNLNTLFSSDNTNPKVFTCDQTGCTITGSNFSATQPGTYTIAVQQDADATHCAVDETFTITVSTITTWSVNGTTQTLTSSDVNITPPVTPTSSDCDNEKVFVGWTTSTITTEQATAPTPLYQTPQLPNNAGNVTYYAVFATQGLSVGSGSGNVTSIPVDEGTYYISHTKSSTTYYLKERGTGNAPETVTEKAQATKFDLVKSGADYIFYVNGDHTKWLYSTNSNDGLRVGTNTDKTWQISDGTRPNGEFDIKHISTNRFISLYLTQDFRGYTSATAANRTENTDLEFAGSAVSYSGYITECCLNTLPKPLVAPSVGDGSIELSWSFLGDISLVSNFVVSCNETSQTATLDNDVTTYTFNGLTNCQNYTFTVRANGISEDVCASTATVSAFPSSSSFTVTFNYGAGTGTPTQWTSGCSNGTSVDLPSPTPPDNYTFVEWRTENGTVVTSPYTPTANITLHAYYQRQPSVDVVEWNPNSVTIELTTEGSAEVMIENQVTSGENTNNVADELFFSKYYEASSNVKLLALYNGTQDPIDLNDYELRISSLAAEDVGTTRPLTVINFMKDVPAERQVLNPKEELILISYLDKNENDSIILECASSDAENSGYNDYIYIGSLLNFSGNDAIALYKNSTMIDIIGAGSGYTAKLGGLITKTDFMDAAGWYNTAGYEIQPDGSAGETQNYALSTNRCLLIRLNTVKSGADAVAKNTTDFVTLGGEFGEWMGYQVLGGNDSEIAVAKSCEGFGFVGGYDYSNYYQTYDSLVSYDLTGSSNPDGTYTIPISMLDTLSCTKMRIQVYDNSKNVLASSEYKIPIMVKATNVTTDKLFSKHGTDVCRDCDVVVLSNATLQKADDGSANDMPHVRDLEIYAGGKLIVPQNTTYTARSLVMRSQADQVPTANINGTLTITDKLYHSKRIDGSRFYFFTLPYDCNVSDITYRNGEALGISGVDYLLKYYDGAGRAAEQNAGHWEVYTGETLHAGIGYIIAVEAPLNDSFTNNPKKEILFPMTNLLAETTNKTVAIGTYGIGDPTIGDNHKGWNLIGVPFMSNYNPISSIGLKVGTYQNGDWDNDGNFTYNPTVTVPYVTIPNVDGTYTQVLASSKNMEPFRSFFVQVGKEDNVITDIAFDYAARQASPPQSIVRIGAPWVELSLLKGQYKDVTTIIVDDSYSTAYEIGADLEKMLGYATLPQFYSLQSNTRLAFNALPSDAAAKSVKLGFYVPTSDSYTISLNKALSSDIEGVYLTDDVTGITTNLMQNDYTFTSDRITNETRFSVAIIRIATAVENTFTSNCSAYTNNRSLYIHNAPIGSTLRVYDTLGREVISENISTETLQYSLPNVGVYLVQIISKSAKSVYKVVCY